MKTAYKALLAGILAIVFAGPALAHGTGQTVGVYYNGYYGNGLSGNVSVWGNSYGQSGWSGSLNYGSSIAYAPVYVVPPPHAHGPACYHQPRRGYGKAYRKGYKHGRRDARHHGKGHGNHQ
jgi:hypothetical protein